MASSSVVRFVMILCAVLAIFVECKSTANVPSEIFNNHSSCVIVKDYFVEKNIGSLKDTKDFSREDETPLCSSSWNASCCTPTMERRYTEASKRHFQAIVQSSNAFLHSILATSAAKFKETFLEMIHTSHNNTNVLFSEVYKRLDHASQEPVLRFYEDLTQSLQGHAPDLESRIRDFFNSLFPLVYHHSLNPQLKDFSEDYKECLRTTQDEIKPFGDIPQRIAHQILKSFRVARTVLESFQTGAEVILAIDTMHFRSDCDAGLAKLLYCSHCSGYTRTRPCGGYCLNVVRGCLAHVAELDQSWGDLVVGLERLVSGMVSSYNVEEVLSGLDTKISEAIMYAMENGPDISKKVKTACGHPRRAARDVSEPRTSIAAGRILPVRSAEDSLSLRLQQVVQRLVETKGHFANLADVVCNDADWAVKEEGQCWNGHALGEYTHTIAGVGVSAQKYNPEMKVPDTDDHVVMALDEKLQKMTRCVRGSVLPDLPQADSFVSGEGSGSGGNRNPVGDDEDYDGSGSGDYGGQSGTKPSDFNFDSGDSSNVNIKVKEKNASFVFRCSNVLIVAASLLVMRLRH